MKKNLDQLKDFEMHSHPDAQDNISGQMLWMLKLQIVVLMNDKSSFQIVTIHHGNSYLWTSLLHSMALVYPLVSRF